MFVYLIESVKAGRQKLGADPATDAQAHFVMEPDEMSRAASFSLSGAGAYAKELRTSDTPFSSDDWHSCIDLPCSPLLDRSLSRLPCFEDTRWELTLTPKRVVVWLPLVSGWRGMKEKPGKATGGIVSYARIDRIEREAPLVLVTEVEELYSADMRAMSGNVIGQRKALKLKFPDVTAASLLSATLATRIAEFWSTEIESAREDLSRGLAKPDSTNAWERSWFESLSKKARLEISPITAELDKLKTFDWSDPNAKLGLSLASVGAPVE